MRAGGLTFAFLCSMSSLPVTELRSWPGPTAGPECDLHAPALEVLARHGSPEPREEFDLESGDVRAIEAGISTLLMDLFRRSRSAEVFDVLMEQSSPQMMRRIRTRLRFRGGHLDPAEVLQDTYVNIYRYPSQFDGRRVGAFHAWSARIVDNAISRQLRGNTNGRELRLLPLEILDQESESPDRDPGAQAIAKESCEQVVRAMALFLQVYLDAYTRLSARERFVLQMVEVHSMRYVELAEVLEIRPEALKMVVFRARRRIFARVQRVLDAGACADER